MKPINVSAHFRQPPDPVWDFIFGDRLRQAVAASRLLEIEGYELRPDGTPRYTMVMKAGPLRIRSVSDYFVYDRPRKTVNRIIGGLFDGGTAYVDLRPEGVGTLVEMRVELMPPNLRKRLALALSRPLLVPTLTAELGRWASAADRSGQ
ncbi:hypothetical protein [Pseudarthrobacter sp. NS4]|uniref:hypothetical protein n=1 Tax=Pseudarthrobacter sp. NS4 TaxID=2973976 RepID=UPI0021639169|nr:hypothetical protein [Pseudarthrobacter sp. NS4]